MDGGGKVTINNYKNTTFGIYSCDLFYAVNDMITYMSKKLKLILKPGQFINLYFFNSNNLKSRQSGKYFLFPN